MAFRLFPNSPEVVTQAARALRLSVTSSRDGAAKAVEAGAADALVRALKTLPQPTPTFARQPTVVALYGHGWRALNSLVSEDPHRTAAQVARAGGADFALKSVPLLIPMRPVLPFAVGTLSLLIQYDSGCREALIAAGAAQARSPLALPCRLPTCHSALARSSYCSSAEFTDLRANTPTPRANKQTSARSS